MCKRYLSASPSPSPPKTFKILGLQQVAIGSLDKENLSNFWGNLLGLQV
jgi:hypothetical protein